MRCVNQKDNYSEYTHLDIQKLKDNHNNESEPLLVSTNFHNNKVPYY